MKVIPKFQAILARRKKQPPGKKRPARKKLSCLPWPCSGDDGCKPGMVMFVLSIIVKFLKELLMHKRDQTKLLQEIKRTLAEKLKPNQCNLQGPMSIENLQICGDGSNTLNMHGPDKKRKRHESDQRSPGSNNNCETSSSTPSQRSHVLSECQMNRFDGDDEVDSGTVQYDQEKNASCVATDCNQREQNWACDKSDDKVESEDCQGGLVDGDGDNDDGCLDGQKQKVNGYQRNQVCLIGVDMNVCLPDSDVDYGGGCNVSRPDDMSEIDEGGVVCGLPNDIEDGGIIPGPMDDEPNSSEVSFSENVCLSDDKVHSQSVLGRVIPGLIDDGPNSSGVSFSEDGVAGMSEGLIADNSVNPQLVEGFEVPGREADPVIRQLTIRGGEVVSKEMSESDGDSVHSYGSEGSCSDDLSGPVQVELVVYSIRMVGQSPHATLLDHVHGTQSEGPASFPGSVQMSSDKPGNEIWFSANGLGSGVLECEGSVSDPVSANEGFGIEQPERFLPAAMHCSDSVHGRNGKIGIEEPLSDSFHLQSDMSFPASIPGIVKSGTNDSLAEIDDRGTERPQSSTFPCLAAADKGMATSKGSVYTEPEQSGDGMKWMKRSLSAPSPDSMQTGNGVKVSRGGFSAAKPQSCLAGYGMEEPEQSQKIGFPGCVDTGSSKPKGDDKPGGNKPWGSFAAGVSGRVEAGMRNVQVSEAHRPVLSDSVLGHQGTAGIEGSSCSPTLPLPVQAGDGMKGSDDCATSSDLSGFGTKETAGSLSADWPESGRQFLERVSE